MSQTRIEIKQSAGIAGEFVDNTPRRVFAYKLEAGDAKAATATITFASNASVNDTVTINGTVFSFKTSANGANEVKIGTTANESAANLAEVLSSVSPYVTAVALNNVVTVVARTAGVIGNTITVLASAATVTAMSGGLDFTPCLFGHAYTQTETGKAVIGGSGDFAGILVNPKEHAHIGDIGEPSFSIKSGANGGLCRFGIIYVKPVNAANIGDKACFSQRNGAIAAYTVNVPAGFITIPQAQFKFANSAAGGLAVLQLGN